MDSSTSSSDKAPARGDGLVRAVALLARAMAPTAAMTIVLLAMAEIWFRADPRERATDLETIVLAEQQRRAETAPAADIVIAGDSSGLMGTDGRLLTAVLQRRVESLAIIGFAGPRGYAALLQQYAARHVPAMVLLMLHGDTLRLDDDTFAAMGLEDWSATGARQRPAPVGVGGRRKIYQHLVARVTAFPLPGAYAVEYGLPQDLRQALNEGQGTLIDPTHGWSARDDGDYTFVLSDAVARQLPAVVDATVAVPEVTLVMTPVPASMKGPSTASSRLAVAERLQTILGARWRLLSTPMTLDDRLFATLTHLTGEGRRVFSQHLAAALVAR